MRNTQRFSTILFLFMGCFGLSIFVAQAQAQEEGSDAGRFAPETQQQEEEFTMSLNDGMKQALEYSTIGRHDQAIELFEKLHVKYPDSFAVLSALTDKIVRRSQTLAQMAKIEEARAYYLRGAGYARKLVEAANAEQQEALKKRLAILLYNEGCALCSNGQTDQALKSLTESFEWGFELVDYMINDVDLFEVADDTRFIDLLGGPEAYEVYREKQLQDAAQQNASFTSVPFDLSLIHI